MKCLILNGWFWWIVEIGFILSDTLIKISFRIQNQISEILNTTKLRLISAIVVENYWE